MVLPICFDTPFECLQLGFLSAPGAALLIYGLAYAQGWPAQFLSHRWVLLLGTSSFSFYLIHDLVIRVLSGVFARLHVSANTALTATTIAAIVFVLIQIVAICLLKMLELPTQKYLRGLARRKNLA